MSLADLLGVRLRLNDDEENRVDSEFGASYDPTYTPSVLDRNVWISGAGEGAAGDLVSFIDAAERGAHQTAVAGETGLGELLGVGVQNMMDDPQGRRVLEALNFPVTAGLLAHDLASSDITETPEMLGGLVRDIPRALGVHIDQPWVAETALSDPEGQYIGPAGYETLDPLGSFVERVDNPAFGLGLDFALDVLLDPFNIPSSTGLAFLPWGRFTRREETFANLMDSFSKNPATSGQDMLKRMADELPSASDYGNGESVVVPTVSGGRLSLSRLRWESPSGSMQAWDEFSGRTLATGENAAEGVDPDKVIKVDTLENMGTTKIPNEVIAFLDYADQNGITLITEASPFNVAGQAPKFNRDQLLYMYNRLGFVPDDTGELVRKPMPLDNELRKPEFARRQVITKEDVLQSYGLTPEGHVLRDRDAEEALVAATEYITGDKANLYDQGGDLSPELMGALTEWVNADAQNVAGASRRLRNALESETSLTPDEGFDVMETLIAGGEGTGRRPDRVLLDQTATPTVRDAFGGESGEDVLVRALEGAGGRYEIGQVPEETLVEIVDEMDAILDLERLEYNSMDVLHDMLVDIGLPEGVVEDTLAQIDTRYWNDAMASPAVQAHDEINDAVRAAQRAEAAPESDALNPLLESIAQGPRALPEPDRINELYRAANINPDEPYEAVEAALDVIEDSINLSRRDPGELAVMGFDTPEHEELFRALEMMPEAFERGTLGEFGEPTFDEVAAVIEQHLGKDEGNRLLQWIGVGPVLTDTPIASPYLGVDFERVGLDDTLNDVRNLLNRAGPDRGDADVPEWLARNVGDQGLIDSLYAEEELLRAMQRANVDFMNVYMVDDELLDGVKTLMNTDAIQFNTFDPVLRGLERLGVSTDDRAAIMNQLMAARRLNRTPIGTAFGNMTPEQVLEGAFKAADVHSFGVPESVMNRVEALLGSRYVNINSALRELEIAMRTNMSRELTDLDVTAVIDNLLDAINENLDPPGNL